MKFTRIKAVAKKELIQIARDPLSLAMAFLMPVMLLFLFGYAITLDVDNLTTAVHDRDRSSLSRELAGAFRESGYFSIIAHVDDHKDIDRLLDSGKAQVVISIPDDFSQNILAGRKAELQVIVDGSDSNTATIALGYAAGIVNLYSQKIKGVKITPLADIRGRVWYNPELESRNYIIPGLIAVIMAVIAALLTSLTVSREWERGTMEQLISTPVKVPELITGKLIPYFLIGFIDIVLSILMATLVFHVPLRGSVPLLMFLSSIFLFGGLGIGILISITAKSQLVSSQIAMVVTFLPAFLLSGFMYAVANMPEALQLLTYIIPARYFVVILKGIFLKGIGLEFLAVEAVLLSIFALTVFLLANRKFKKKVL